MDGLLGWSWRWVASCCERVALQLLKDKECFTKTRMALVVRIAVELFSHVTDMAGPGRGRRVPDNVVCTIVI